ncbi:RAMP superfamily CRISPR-associated protein [Saccharopolyspora griseoalba]|uniref:RAMP superfamily CRISPR-associated protein n=1 Tax=Saccharopolyspora griseoalba TaxID=1431848 RepID=A0ABW2LL28_9PSEU
MRVLVITVRLRMETPGGVTAPEAADDDNLIPIRTDTRGNPHLPGTTVAGSLRALWNGLDSNSAKELFGYIGDGEKPTRVPSKIQVQGTRWLPPDSDAAGEEHAAKPTVGQLTHRRTAIDRVREGPRIHALHGVTMLPAGTCFDVVIRWDNADPTQRQQFLDLLRTWHPRLGRGTSLDAGRCRVLALGSCDYDLTTPRGLHDWLRIGAESGLYPDPTDEVTSPTRQVRTYECRIVDGLHCGAGDESGDANGQPRINRVVKRGKDYVVPASTLKGVLRSRAEYICHAIRASACKDQSCGECMPCNIFGYSPNANDGSSNGNGSSGRRAKIAIQDAVVRDAERRERQHVAIDRFTGGARDQLLYTDEVLVKGHFLFQIHELRTLDDHEWLLIQAVLTDLNDGFVGIGARTTSGLGTVRVIKPDLDLPENRPDLSSLAHRLAPEAEATP